MQDERKLHLYRFINILAPSLVVYSFLRMNVQVCGGLACIMTQRSPQDSWCQCPYFPCFVQTLEPGMSNFSYSSPQETRCPFLFLGMTGRTLSQRPSQWELSTVTSWLLKRSTQSQNRCKWRQTQCHQTLLSEGYNEKEIGEDKEFAVSNDDNSN